VSLDFIKFNCPHCDKRIKVPSKYAGGQGKCPQCHQNLKVPDIEHASDQYEHSVIKFRCPHCSQKIGVHEQYAGKRVRCKNCREPIQIPVPEPEETLGSQLLQTADSSDEAGQDIGIQGLLPDDEPGATAVEQELRVEPAESKGSESQKFDSTVMVSGSSVFDGTPTARGVGMIFKCMPLAIFASFFAAILGAVIWTVVVCVSGFELGIIAIAVGALAGGGLRAFTDRKGIGMGIIAAAFALIGIFAGKAMVAHWYILPMLEEQVSKFELDDEWYREIVNNPEMMYCATCLHLAEQGEFDQEFAWELSIYKFGGEIPPQANREDIELADKKCTDLLNSWSDSEKLDVARAQANKLTDQFTDFMFASGIGFIIAFIASFSLFDLLWFILALVTAYRVGSGGG
jgi:transcription elongation factor Elf1